MKTKCWIYALLAVLLCAGQSARAGKARLIPLRIFRVPQEWTYPAFAPDGQHAAWFEMYAGDAIGSIWISSIEKPKKKIRVLQTAEHPKMTWDSSGNLLLICTGKKTVLVRFEKDYAHSTARQLPVQWDNGCFFGDSQHLLGMKETTREAQILELLNLSTLQRTAVKTFPVEAFSPDAYQFIPQGKDKILMPIMGYALDVQGKLTRIHRIGEGLMYDFVLGVFPNDSVLHCYQPYEPRGETMIMTVCKTELHLISQVQNTMLRLPWRPNRRIMWVQNVGHDRFWLKHEDARDELILYQIASR